MKPGGVRPTGHRGERIVDVVIAGTLLVVTAPLLLAVAAAVLLDSGRPVLYRARRVGLGGCAFDMLKFRTMIHDADTTIHEEFVEGIIRGDVVQDEDVELHKLTEDPRITRVGRILRRFSIDELPQLINVIRGDMSVVGPRPLVVDEDERVIGRHRRRLQLKPGMTGQWQVLGSARVPLSEMLVIDYLYVGNWSLWSDVKILLRTVPHVLGRRGL